MSASESGPHDLGLRYGLASVFERADVRSPEMAQLRRGDAFEVVGAEGEFYRVRLPDGTVGFVFDQNIVGSGLPLTESERRQAAEAAAAAGRVPAGWRGLLARVRRACSV